MKITTKLSLAMILVAIIPLIFINFIAEAEIKSKSIASFENGFTRISYVQSDNLGMVLGQFQEQSKNIVLNPYISMYTSIMNYSKYDRKYHPNYDQIEKCTEITQNNLDLFQMNNANVEAAVILNSNGEIVASSGNSESFLELMTEDGADLIRIANNKGISDLFELKVNGNNTPVFYCCKNISDAEGEPIGTFVQLCTTSQIQKNLSSEKPYNTSSFLVIDKNGNVLASPYSKVSNYNSNDTYSELRSFIAGALSDSNGDAGVSEMKYNNTNILAYSSAIPNSEWTLISIVNQNELLEGTRSMTSGIRTSSFGIFVLDIAVIVVFVIFFTKPILNIVNILTKKSRGDQSARFEVTSYDEFGQIGKAFNTMFDDVFESEQRYRTIVEMTDNIVFEINFAKKNVFVSNNFNQKFSFRAKSDDLSESFFFKGRIHKDDRDRYFKDLDRILGTANYLQGEYRFKNIYGDFAWVLIRATKFYTRDEVPTKIVGVIADIDREKKDEIRLVQRANYDALTEIYNRESFIKALANEFELSAMRKTMSAVLFIDLDDFKHFNDDYGHSCGDEVLKYTADCLKEILFNKGFAGRFGGDEFVICVNNPTADGADSANIAQEIIDALGRGFTSDSTGMHLSINCSIGIAFFNENGKNCEEVLNAADEAMYGVKKHGKSNYGFASSRKEGAPAPVPKPIDSENETSEV